MTVHLNLAKVADTLGKKQMIEKSAGYTVLTTSMNVATMRQLFFKRAMDIARWTGGLYFDRNYFCFYRTGYLYQFSGDRFSSRRIESVETERNLKFTNSVVCIWMQKSGKQN